MAQEAVKLAKEPAHLQRVGEAVQARARSGNIERAIYDHYKVKEGRDDQEEQNQSC